MIVIGGGPAGMMAAGRSAERGLSVCLLEKNNALGKKLSITGGGRCNITNAEFDVRTLLSHYGKAESFLYSAFSQFGVQDTFDFFTERGLSLVVEDRKRAFPNTHNADDVTSVMNEYVTKNNVVIETGVAVTGFKYVAGRISGVVTNRGVYRAKKYIIACGGRSRGETGSTGEVFTWLSDVGHTTHRSNPNLVPLVVKEMWVRDVSGTVLKNARITFQGVSSRVVKSGDVLITHFGISGPTILNSAYEVQKQLAKGVVYASIDLFPTEDVGALRVKFQQLAELHGNKTLHNALREWFEAGVARAILASFDKDIPLQKMHMLSREVRRKIVDAMKGIPLTITGVKGFDWAVVSDGGVDLKEIDTRTMQSKIHDNLYIVGDTLHIQRPSGGYSLQLCWTTGWVAGNNV